MTSFPADVWPRTKWSLALIFGVIGGFVVGIVVLVFLWPTTSATARNLPVSIVGSESAVADFAVAIGAASPGLLTLVEANDRDDAMSQIETRTTVGAIILADTPEVLTAPASSLASTYILTAVANHLEMAPASGVANGSVDAAPGPESTAVTVTQVVPLSDTDPYGAGLASLTFPRLLGGVIGGLVVSLFVAGMVRRFAALLAFGAVSGPVLAWVTHSGMGILQGDFVLNALGVPGHDVGDSSGLVKRENLRA